MNDIAGIILAAGASKRMGRPKQLLPVGEFNLVEMVLQEAIQSVLGTVVLVLGYESDAIKRNIRPSLVHHHKLKIIHNSGYKNGMSTSIILSLKIVEKEYDQVMFLLSDMPYLSASIINHLIKGYWESGSDLCALKVKKRRSLPVIVSRKYYPDMHRLRGDIGARDLFVKYANEVSFIEAPEAYHDFDLDTPEDYEEYLKTYTTET